MPGAASRTQNHLLGWYSLELRPGRPPAPVPGDTDAGGGLAGALGGAWLATLDPVAHDEVGLLPQGVSVDWELKFPDAAAEI